MVDPTEPSVSAPTAVPDLVVDPETNTIQEKGVPSPSEAETSEPTNGDALTFSKEAFAERLTQAKRSAIKSMMTELGFEKPEQLQEYRRAADAAIKAERERSRAKMSELEKLEQDLQAEKIARQADVEARTEAEKQAESLRVQNHLHGLFIQNGIKNTDYALFKVEAALANLDEGEELDEVGFLRGLCDDEMERAALGLSAEQVAIERREANTSAPRRGPDPKPQAGDDDFDAMSATPEELERRLQQLGFHG